MLNVMNVMNGDNQVSNDAYLPVSRQLQMYSLSELLKFDQESRKTYDQCLKWFVSKCSRKEAEMILLEEFLKTKIEGTFVLRPCSKNNNDLCISLVCNLGLYHYRIYNFGDCYYQMENSKMFFGLDTLIDYYTTQKELVVCLAESVQGVCSPIAMETRSKGFVTILHKACSYGDINLIDEIIAHPLRGHVDERDPSGSTALHIASSFGYCDIIERLISSCADIHKHDSNGRTPLHRVVEDDNPIACRLLIEAGADINAIDRNRSTPMHIAARYNSSACIKVLLECKATLFPRDKDLLTPWDIAFENKRLESLDVLKQEIFVQFTNTNTKLPYLFSKISKAEAKDLLRSAGNTSGSFLIRRSETKNSYVLSMIANSEFCNYDIDVNDLGCYYISDGPLFFSLEQLVDYYSHFQDRLQAKLEKPMHANSVYAQKPKETNSSINIGNTDSTASYKDNTVSLKRIQQNNTINNSFRNSSKPRRNSDRKEANQINAVGKDNVKFTAIKSSSIGSSAGISSDKSLSFSEEPQNLHADVNDRNSKTFRYIRMFNYLFKNGMSENIGNHVNKISDRINSVVSKYPKASNRDIIPHEGLMTIEKSQLDFIKKIGEGEFGLVFEGYYRPDKNTGKNMTVAIKMLKVLSPEAMFDFKQEAKIMAALKHHCIVKIYGLCEDNNELMMILEFIHYGSLLKLLRDNRRKISLDHINRWALQIADALSFMEENQFVHRDLSARNVLVASFNQIKVSDFGLSRSTIDNIYEQHSCGKIPIKWYAIEAIEKNRFTSKSDVWSYGITLWEMFTFGKEPYDNMTGAQVYEFIRQGKKLSKPKLCSPSTYEIITKCTDLDENKRPTFKQIKEYFNTQTPFDNSKGS